MFLTQVYGTILGGFINYAVMISIVGSNRDILRDTNGDSSWSGATIQSYNTNATSWALAKYLYKSGTRYEMVPIGIAIGAGVVVLHRVIVYVRSLFQPQLHIHLACANFDGLVRPKDPWLPSERDKPAPIHSICGIHPIQCLPDMCDLQPGHRRLLHSVLSSQLPTSPFQGLLVFGHRRLRWCKSHGTIYSFICGLRRWRTFCSFPRLVG